MKKKIQKYLAGEREGFSLVELIIVIAIMAILVGVVALAVLPNIKKSQESKDLATLDSVCSALNAAVANTKVTGSGDFEYTATSGVTGDALTVQTEMKKLLGNGSSTLVSSNTGSAKIRCKFDVANNQILVYAGSAAGTAVLLESNETGFKADLSKDTTGKALVVSN